ncbi:MAG: hypothetical protein M3354_02180 [Chloroflexota bacterium]|nr:hypothetical protein [Chloroflexota bacterium]
MPKQRQRYRKTNLTPDQREFLNRRFEEALVAGVSPGRADLARVVWLESVRAAEVGDAEENRLLSDLALDGMEMSAKDFLNADSGVISFPSAAGQMQVESVPARASIRSKRDDGSIAYQTDLWWELTWEEFASWRIAILSIEQRIAAKRHAFQRVETLHELFPDSATPGEACEQAGIDPRDFALGELAA